MLVSNPDSEKRQMSAALVPEAGRARGMGFPPRLQAFVEVLNPPRAATLRSKETEESSTPAVVGSTTVMFLPEMAGEEPESVMTSSVVPGAATTRETMLERVPEGLCIWIEMLPGCTTSVLLAGAEQELTELQVVTRAVPPMSSVEPGPGFERTKPLPSTVSVKPFAPPA